MLSDNYTAKTNHVWQIPTQAALIAEGTDPLLGAVYAETLRASPEGIIAKNAFVFGQKKHPTRNFFVFYKREVGDVTFPAENAHPSQVIRSDWMDKDEEDAFAELDEKANDPSGELEETLLESIIGVRKL
jgi:hypothetical protein